MPGSGRSLEEGMAIHSSILTGKIPRTEEPDGLQSMEFSRPEYWNGYPFPSPGDLPNPGIEPRSPALQADSLPAEPQGKTKDTGVGSLSLLQGIFVTQESNWGLLRCRWILYQLSHQAPNSIQKPRQSLLLLGRDWKLPPNTHQTHPQGLDTEDLTKTEAEDWLGCPTAPLVTSEASITHREPNYSCQWGEPRERQKN